MGNKEVVADAWRGGSVEDRLEYSLVKVSHMHLCCFFSHSYQKGPKVRSRNKAQHIEDGKICLSLLATDSKVKVYRMLH